MVNSSGVIIHKVRYKKGKIHDYNIYKKNHPVTPNQVVVNVFDLGYLGVEKDFPEQISPLPNKKKRDVNLSIRAEKEYNQGYVKKRIVIEDTIRRIKKCRIMADIFRNKFRKYRISDMVSGLINYKIINHHH